MGNLITVNNGGILTSGFREISKITMSSTNFQTGSIFEWALGSGPSTSGRGTDYDAVNTSGLSGTGGIFRVEATKHD